MLRASIDLMGGDNAPFAALKAAAKINDVHFLFVGNQETLKTVKEYGIANYELIEANFQIKEGEKVTRQQLENSSMYIAISQLKNEKADFIVSAGPSGYYLLLCRQILGTLGGLSRPALATIIPTEKSPAVMMDLGANLTCSEQDLINFAIIGKALAEFWLGYKKPRVGFVNVGSELGKGPDIVKNAAARFKETEPEISVSFVEGNGIMAGNHDVIIVDGFTGNCLLKFGEGIANFFKETLKQGLNDGLYAKMLGLFLKNKIKSAMIDPRKYNGGIFAGVNGCAIKSHGNSDEIAYEYAIRFGMNIANNKQIFLSTIETDLLKYAT